MTTKITLHGDEIGLAIAALDFYSRIWIGQYGEILWKHRQCLDYRDIERIEEEAKNYLSLLRMTIMPEIGPELNGSHGIFNPKVDGRSALSYNLQQVIRYKYAYARFPEGGMGVSFGKPLKAGTTDLPTGKIEKVDDEWVIHVEGKSEEDTKKYKETLLDALTIYKDLMDADVVKLFSYYTDNEKALSYAKRVQNLYRESVKDTDIAREERERSERLLRKMR